MTNIEKARYIVNVAYNKMGKYIWKKPNIRTIDETLDYIYLNRVSVSRFGDGEFAIIEGHCNSFQKADAILAKRLSEILKSNLECHIVCLPDVFDDLSYLTKESRCFQNGLLNSERRNWLNLIDIDKIYYNTFITRPYNMFLDKSNSESWFKKLKAIFENQDVLLIEGDKSRLGVGNDLFDQTNSLRQIPCPSENAFDKYTEILNAAQLYGKNCLILVALGMTATVLSYDLAKLGYWAIDIGHIDIEYEWFLMGATSKVELKGKYTNEVKGGREVEDLCDVSYQKSIALRVN